jgi:hypothetical protein
MDSKDQTKKSVIVQAELLLKGNVLYGWKFKAIDEEGQELLEDILNGRVEGLPYSKKTTIAPFAGGAGEYWVSILP